MCARQMCQGVLEYFFSLLIIAVEGSYLSFYRLSYLFSRIEKYMKKAVDWLYAQYLQNNI